MVPVPVAWRPPPIPVMDWLVTGRMGPMKLLAYGVMVIVAPVSMMAKGCGCVIDMKQSVLSCAACVLTAWRSVWFSCGPRFRTRGMILSIALWKVYSVVSCLWVRRMRALSVALALGGCLGDGVVVCSAAMKAWATVQKVAKFDVCFVSMLRSFVVWMCYVL